MIRLGVIGAGAMGSNHARIAAANHRIDLAYVVDPNTEVAEPIAGKYGAAYSDDYRRVMSEIDAAVVAAPTRFHRRIVLDLLDAGVHVLVEKPIALDSNEGRELAAAADASGCVLTVGHVERFNPAIIELESLITKPIHIEAMRVGPYTNRIEDGVTLDLMIHDLDLVAALAKSPVGNIQSLRRDVMGTDDLSVALLVFESGVSATVTASRLGQSKTRSLTVTQAESTICADLITQSLSVHRLGRVESSATPGGFRQTGIVEIPLLSSRGEPLHLELDHFVDCVIDGALPKVSAKDGVAALELVERVRAAAVTGV